MGASYTGRIGRRRAAFSAREGRRGRFPDPGGAPRVSPASPTTSCPSTAAAPRTSSGAWRTPRGPKASMPASSCRWRAVRAGRRRSWKWKLTSLDRPGPPRRRGGPGEDAGGWMRASARSCAWTSAGRLPPRMRRTRCPERVAESL